MRRHFLVKGIGVIKITDRHFLYNLLAVLSLDHVYILDPLGVVRDVLDRGGDPLDPLGHVVDQVEGGVGASVGHGHGVVQGHGRADGLGCLLLSLHVLEDVDDAVIVTLLLLDLLEHKLADLGELLDHAELAGQLGGVNDLARGEAECLDPRAGGLHLQ